MSRYDITYHRSRGTDLAAIDQSPLGPAGPRLLGGRVAERSSRVTWSLLGSIAVHAGMAFVMMIIARRIPPLDQPAAEMITLVFEPPASEPCRRGARTTSAGTGGSSSAYTRAASRAASTTGNTSTTRSATGVAGDDGPAGTTTASAQRRSLSQLPSRSHHRQRPFRRRVGPHGNRHGPSPRSRVLPRHRQFSRPGPRMPPRPP